MALVKRWYVARSKPHKELVLATFLKGLDVETYYPMIRRADKSSKNRIEPLFPGYLFCHLDIQTREWPQIRWAIGLSHFLSADGQPTPVPDDLVKYLKDRTYRWNTEPPVARFDTGSRIAIASGPLVGMEGIFQRYVSSQQRCRVLLETVGGLMTVETETSRLRPAVSARMQL